MSNIEIENETISGRVPVFKVEPDENIESIVLNEIRVDDKLTNVSMNETALRFLRKKKLVDNINESSTAVYDLNDITYGIVDNPLYNNQEASDTDTDTETPTATTDKIRHYSSNVCTCDIKSDKSNKMIEIHPIYNDALNNQALNIQSNELEENTDIQTKKQQIVHANLSGLRYADNSTYITDTEIRLTKSDLDLSENESTPLNGYVVTSEYKPIDVAADETSDEYKYPDTCFNIIAQSLINNNFNDDTIIYNGYAVFPGDVILAGSKISSQSFYIKSVPLTSFPEIFPPYTIISQKSNSNQEKQYKYVMYSEMKINSSNFNIDFIPEYSQKSDPPEYPNTGRINKYNISTISDFKQTEDINSYILESNYEVPTGQILFIFPDNLNSNENIKINPSVIIKDNTSHLQYVYLPNYVLLSLMGLTVPMTDESNSVSVDLIQTITTTPITNLKISNINSQLDNFLMKYIYRPNKQKLYTANKTEHGSLLVDLNINSISAKPKYTIDLEDNFTQTISNTLDDTSKFSDYSISLNQAEEKYVPVSEISFNSKSNYKIIAGSIISGVEYTSNVPFSVSDINTEPFSYILSTSNDSIDVDNDNLNTRLKRTSNRIYAPCKLKTTDDMSYYYTITIGAGSIINLVDLNDTTKRTKTIIKEASEILLCQIGKNSILYPGSNFNSILRLVDCVVIGLDEANPGNYVKIPLIGWCSVSSEKFKGCLNGIKYGDSQNYYNGTITHNFVNYISPSDSINGCMFNGITYDDKSIRTNEIIVEVSTDFNHLSSPIKTIYSELSKYQLYNGYYNSQKIYELMCDSEDNYSKFRRNTNDYWYKYYDTIIKSGGISSSDEVMKIPNLSNKIPIDYYSDNVVINEQYSTDYISSSELQTKYTNYYGGELLSGTKIYLNDDVPILENDILGPETTLYGFETAFIVPKNHIYEITSITYNNASNITDKSVYSITYNDYEIGKYSTDSNSDPSSNITNKLSDRFVKYSYSIDNVYQDVYSMVKYGFVLQKDTIFAFPFTFNNQSLIQYKLISEPNTGETDYEVLPNSTVKILNNTEIEFTEPEYIKLSSVPENVSITMYRKEATTPLFGNTYNLGKGTKITFKGYAAEFITSNTIGINGNINGLVAKYEKTTNMIDVEWILSDDKSISFITEDSKYYISFIDSSETIKLQVLNTGISIDGLLSTTYTHSSSLPTNKLLTYKIVSVDTSNTNENAEYIIYKTRKLHSNETFKLGHVIHSEISSQTPIQNDILILAGSFIASGSILNLGNMCYEGDNSNIEYSNVNSNINVKFICHSHEKCRIIENGVIHELTYLETFETRLNTVQYYDTFGLQLQFEGIDNNSPISFNTGKLKISKVATKVFNTHYKITLNRNDKIGALSSISNFTNSHLQARTAILDNNTKYWNGQYKTSKLFENNSEYHIPYEKENNDEIVYSNNEIISINGKSINEIVSIDEHLEDSEKLQLKLTLPTSLYYTTGDLQYDKLNTYTYLTTQSTKLIDFNLTAPLTETISLNELNILEGKQYSYESKNIVSNSDLIIETHLMNDIKFKIGNEIEFTINKLSTLDIGIEDNGIEETILKDIPISISTDDANNTVNISYDYLNKLPYSTLDINYSNTTTNTLSIDANKKGTITLNNGYKYLMNNSADLIKNAGFYCNFTDSEIPSQSSLDDVRMNYNFQFSQKISDELIKTYRVVFSNSNSDEKTWEMYDVSDSTLPPKTLKGTYKVNNINNNTYYNLEEINPEADPIIININFNNLSYKILYSDDNKTYEMTLPSDAIEIFRIDERNIFENGVISTSNISNSNSIYEKIFVKADNPNISTPNNKWIYDVLISNSNSFNVNYDSHQLSSNIPLNQNVEISSFKPISIVFTENTTPGISDLPTKYQINLYNEALITPSTTNNTLIKQYFINKISNGISHDESNYNEYYICKTLQFNYNRLAELSDTLYLYSDSTQIDYHHYNSSVSTNTPIYERYYIKNSTEYNEHSSNFNYSDYLSSPSNTISKINIVFSHTGLSNEYLLILNSNSGNTKILRLSSSDITKTIYVPNTQSITSSLKLYSINQGYEFNNYDCKILNNSYSKVDRVNYERYMIITSNDNEEYLRQYIIISPTNLSLSMDCDIYYNIECDVVNSGSYKDNSFKTENIVVHEFTVDPFNKTFTIPARTTLTNSIINSKYYDSITLESDLVLQDSNNYPIFAKTGSVINGSDLTNDCYIVISSNTTNTPYIDGYEVRTYSTISSGSKFKTYSTIDGVKLLYYNVDNVYRNSTAIGSWTGFDTVIADGSILLPSNSDTISIQLFNDLDNFSNVTLITDNPNSIQIPKSSIINNIDYSQIRFNDNNDYVDTTKLDDIYIQYQSLLTAGSLIKENSIINGITYSSDKTITEDLTILPSDIPALNPGASIKAGSVINNKMYGNDIDNISESIILNPGDILTNYSKINNNTIINLWEAKEGDIITGFINYISVNNGTYQFFQNNGSDVYGWVSNLVIRGVHTTNYPYDSIIKGKINGILIRNNYVLINSSTVPYMITLGSMPTGTTYIGANSTCYIRQSEHNYNYINGNLYNNSMIVNTKSYSNRNYMTFDYKYTSGSSTYEGTYSRTVYSNNDNEYVSLGNGTMLPTRTYRIYNVKTRAYEMLTFELQTIINGFMVDDLSIDSVLLSGSTIKAGSEINNIKYIKDTTANNLKIIEPSTISYLNSNKIKFIVDAECILSQKVKIADNTITSDTANKHKLIIPNATYTLNNNNNQSISPANKPYSIITNYSINGLQPHSYYSMKAPVKFEVIDLTPEGNTISIEATIENKYVSFENSDNTITTDIVDMLIDEEHSQVLLNIPIELTLDPKINEYRYNMLFNSTYSTPEYSNYLKYMKLYKKGTFNLYAESFHTNKVQLYPLSQDYKIVKALNSDSYLIETIEDSLLQNYILGVVDNENIYTYRENISNENDYKNSLFTKIITYHSKDNLTFKIQNPDTKFNLSTVAYNRNGIPLPIIDNNKGKLYDEGYVKVMANDEYYNIDMNITDGKDDSTTECKYIYTKDTKEMILKYTNKNKICNLSMVKVESRLTEYYTVIYRDITGGFDNAWYVSISSHNEISVSPSEYNIHTVFTFKDNKISLDLSIDPNNLYYSPNKGGHTYSFTHLITANIEIVNNYPKTNIIDCWGTDVTYTVEYASYNDRKKLTIVATNNGNNKRYVAYRRTAYDYYWHEFSDLSNLTEAVNDTPIFDLLCIYNNVASYSGIFLIKTTNLKGIDSLVDDIPILNPFQTQEKIAWSQNTFNIKSGSIEFNNVKQTDTYTFNMENNTCPHIVNLNNIEYIIKHYSNSNSEAYILNKLDEYDYSNKNYNVLIKNSNIPTKKEHEYFSNLQLTNEEKIFKSLNGSNELINIVNTNIQLDSTNTFAIVSHEQSPIPALQCTLHYNTDITFTYKLTSITYNCSFNDNILTIVLHANQSLTVGNSENLLPNNLPYIYKNSITLTSDGDYDIGVIDKGLYTQGKYFQFNTGIYSDSENKYEFSIMSNVSHLLINKSTTNGLSIFKLMNIYSECKFDSVRIQKTDDYYIDNTTNTNLTFDNIGYCLFNSENSENSNLNEGSEFYLISNFTDNTSSTGAEQTNELYALSYPDEQNDEQNDLTILCPNVYKTNDLNIPIQYGFKNVQTGLQTFNIDDMGNNAVILGKSQLTEHDIINNMTMNEFKYSAYSDYINWGNYTVKSDKEIVIDNYTLLRHIKNDKTTLTICLTEDSNSIDINRFSGKRVVYLKSYGDMTNFEVENDIILNTNGGYCVFSNWSYDSNSIFSNNSYNSFEMNNVKYNQELKNTKLIENKYTSKNNNHASNYNPLSEIYVYNGETEFTDSSLISSFIETYSNPKYNVNILTNAYNSSGVFEIPSPSDYNKTSLITPTQIRANMNVELKLGASNTTFENGMNGTRFVYDFKYNYIPAKSELNSSPDKVKRFYNFFNNPFEGYSYTFVLRREKRYR